ncbi:unnamed protein product [Spirodela intermedia]|uniref:Uncharacterized protein n=2 Tax=Spirodela intermedia TaxID=51605 RepID=A0A7I8IAY8_SPIIN|nr:unnamed protein product [Spirodela intermedia]CAA6654564.1 unnamed protein product [Spirodela intermedia]CAA7389198.1 unnamed protein product [Spirodela intermedia]
MSCFSIMYMDISSCG